MKFDKYLKKGRVKIIIKANSPENRITGYDEDRDALRVEIKEPAQDNKANIEIIKYFRKLTGRNVRILRGITSKRKTIELS